MEDLSRPGNRVLVIEDDDPTRTLFTALLERSGFKVECTRDGSAALDSLLHLEYDVILLDLLMPGLDGFALLEDLQTMRPEVARRTLVVSGAAPVLLTRLERSGIAGVVRKPFEIDDLLTRIRHIAAGAA
jgi:CheY-like chemotaxis protein